MTLHSVKSPRTTMTDDDYRAERWLPVVGWEGLYEVSDHGRVRSLDRRVVSKQGYSYHRRGRVLKPSLNSSRRLWVEFIRNESKQRALVHQVVLAAFVGPRPAGMETLHWDDDPCNNRLSNLRYGTRSENQRDCIRNGLNPNANKTRCKYGHEFTPENTYLTRSGGRVCRACMRVYRRDWESRQKGEEMPSRLTDNDFRVVMRLFGFHDLATFRDFVAQQQRKRDRSAK